MSRHVMSPSSVSHPHHQHRARARPEVAAPRLPSAENAKEGRRHVMCVRARQSAARSVVMPHVHSARPLVRRLRPSPRAVALGRRRGRGGGVVRPRARLTPRVTKQRRPNYTTPERAKRPPIRQCTPGPHPRSGFWFFLTRVLVCGKAFVRLRLVDLSRAPTGTFFREVNPPGSAEMARQNTRCTYGG